MVTCSTYVITVLNLTKQKSVSVINSSTRVMSAALMMFTYSRVEPIAAED
ncbi:MAG TPA: hypothetical protein VJT69_04885 [Pyrinomonadaceae bacterium]|nr:hypothetical protein [Pyrinomonadaceae bacterium]